MYVCESVDSLIVPKKVKAQNSIITSINLIAGQWSTHACMPVSIVRFVNIYYHLTCFLSITILPTFSEKCHRLPFFVSGNDDNLILYMHTKLIRRHLHPN